MRRIRFGVELFALKRWLRETKRRTWWRVALVFVVALSLFFSAFSWSYQGWIKSENDRGQELQSQKQGEIARQNELDQREHALRVEDTNNQNSGLDREYERDYSLWLSDRNMREEAYGREFTLWKFENDTSWTRYYDLNRSQTLLRTGFQGFTVLPRGGGLGDTLTEAPLNPPVAFVRLPGTNFLFGPVQRLTRIDYVRVVAIVGLGSLPPTNVTVSITHEKLTLNITRFEVRSAEFQGYDTGDHWINGTSTAITLEEGETAYVNIVAESAGIVLHSDSFVWFYLWEAAVATPSPPVLPPPPVPPVIVDLPNRPEHKMLPAPPLPRTIDRFVPMSGGFFQRIPLNVGSS